jgi:hypothetical protein
MVDLKVQYEALQEEVTNAVLGVVQPASCGIGGDASTGLRAEMETDSAPLRQTQRRNARIIIGGFSVTFSWLRRLNSAETVRSAYGAAYTRLVALKDRTTPPTSSA